MHHPPEVGSILAEALVAMVLLSLLALAAIPATLQVQRTQWQGRTLLAGHDLIARRLAVERGLGIGPCRTAAGRDSAALALVSWRLDPDTSMVSFVAVLSGPVARWPAETVASRWPCTP